MFRSLLLSFCATLCLISTAEASQMVNAPECRLFELAYKVTNTQKGAAFSDILVGCPGYEDWTSEMSIRQNSIAFQKAQNAQKPRKIETGSAAEKFLFQRMITRGVPVDIAQSVVETRVFAKAVAAANR